MIELRREELEPHSRASQAGAQRLWTVSREKLRMVGRKLYYPGFCLFLEIQRPKFFKAESSGPYR